MKTEDKSFFCKYPILLRADSERELMRCTSNLFLSLNDLLVSCRQIHSISFSFVMLFISLIINSLQQKHMHFFFSFLSHQNLYARCRDLFFSLFFVLSL